MTGPINSQSTNNPSNPLSPSPASSNTNNPIKLESDLKKLEESHDEFIPNLSNRPTEDDGNNVLLDRSNSDNSTTPDSAQSDQAKSPWEFFQSLHNQTTKTENDESNTL
ncbi:MAG: hypothetical protein QNJ31_04880 [Candidatus Caenarcaniphilales bacterium]|nr:hypothetical protein [Candidatus Caenarcaniphilales bacterium]